MSRRSNVELIAFDLRSIIKSHPEHTAVIEALTAGSNPRFLWGVQTADCIMKEHGRIDGLFENDNETSAQRDRRIMVSMREDLFESLSYVDGPVSDDLMRLLFEIKPAYFYAYYVDGKAAKKVLNRRKAVYDSGIAPLNFDNLLKARNELTSLIAEVYGDKGMFTPLSTEAPTKRFSVFICESGLNVRVLLSHKEGRGRDVTVGGTAFAEYTSMVPTSFACFPVKTDYWTLDQSVCDPE